MELLFEQTPLCCNLKHDKKLKTNISLGCEKVKLSFMKLNCSFSSDSTPVLMKTVRLWNWRGSISFLLCVTYGYPNSFAKHILDRAYCIPDPKGNMHNLHRNTASISLLQLSLPWAPCGCTFFGFSGSAPEILVAAAFRFFFFFLIRLLIAKWTVSSFPKCLNSSEYGIHRQKLQPGD